MKYFSKQNVYETAKDRIRFLYDEFEEIVVGFSGGKDSTVTLNLAIEVAKEKNRLPVKLLFVDQEAEWQTVIDYVRTQMYREEVEPMWFQIPIRLFNATSNKEPWLMCWEEGKEWIREKEPISYKINKYGEDRFKEMFGKILNKEFSDKKTCYLAGVRAEESPTRHTSLTTGPVYKHITYGKTLNKGKEHYTFYPLYDWSYTDIWKSIHDNKWDYCKIYDYQYMYGINVKDMRVSNLHHETAVHSLFYLQEIESETYQKLVKRIGGIDTAGKIGKSDFFVHKLPFMFRDWIEYRNYLLEHLIEDRTIQGVEISKEKFRKKFKQLDEKYKEFPDKEVFYKTQINTILLNDFSFTKLDNLERNPDIHGWRQYMKGVDHKNNKTNKYIKMYEKNKGIN